MDKEAQHIIAGAITNNLLLRVPQPIIRADVFVMAEEILKRLELLGYRKPPEGQPPLLTSKELDKVADDTLSEECLNFVSNAIKAQREADIKWYAGQE